jgi:uncharacterized membrane protein YphA (DoxX/SURF4 family)
MNFASASPISWMVWILAAAMAAAAVVNFRGPAVVVQEFRQLGYPAWLRPAVALAESVCTLLLLVPLTQTAGAWLSALILLGVLVSIARQGDSLRLHYPLVLLALSVALIAVSPV